MGTKPGKQAERFAGGLSSEEAQARLREQGPNVLPAPPGPSALRRLLEQFVHFFALMLWIAGALAFVADLPQLGAGIFAVIVLNAIFAFAQEYRADRSAERLRDLLPHKATVLRDGKSLTIEAGELVTGDVVLLSAGDRISADLTTQEVHSLLVDTSALTGESVPEAVDTGDDLYAGTFATGGEGTGVVKATGGQTRLAEIAGLARAARHPEPPLAVELKRVVRTIAYIALAVGGGFFLVALLLGTSPAAGLTFAIGVTVALVPEGLLPTVTLSLAIGAQRMAERKALVRRLESVETLGSTTFICTDKTGTLTTGQMQVVDVWTPTGRTKVSGRGYEPAGEIVFQSPESRGGFTALVRAAVACSGGRAVLNEGVWEAQGDPLEVALDVVARRAGLPSVDEAVPEVVRRFPFDPRRRCMSIVTPAEVLVKGAPDSVFPLCSGDVDPAQVALERMTGAGLRVIAVARRGTAGPLPASAGEAEAGLTLLGLAGIQDGPRPEAREALAACRTAGIKVAMITGDHPLTAHAIAVEVGLAGPGGFVITGSQLPATDEALGELVDRDGIVLARIEPEDKLRIARALRQRGHIVAMTGDGVNDAPALTEADIGVAMGRSGTDVARESADLVLLDDNFATIVAAVEMGRAIFSNARNFLTYHLTDNVAELTPFVVWVLSGGRFPLALGVLQVLALDLGTDTLSATALGAEPPAGDVLRRTPERGRLLDKRVITRAFAFLGPAEAGMSMLAFVATLLAEGWRPGDAFPGRPVLQMASGATFTSIVLAQAANAFACRSSVLPPWKLRWLGNRLLIGGVCIGLAVAMACVFIGPLASVLGQRIPSATGLTVGAASMGAVLLVDYLTKTIHPRRLRTPKPKRG